MDNIQSTLNVTIEDMNLAKETSRTIPAKAAFGSVSALLAIIRDSIIRERDFVDLGLYCAEVCKALERGLNGRQVDELSQSVLGAIELLTATVTVIRGKVIKESKRNPAFRLLYARGNKEKIFAWKQDLNRILQVFSAELVINTHVLVADMHRNALGADISRLNPGCEHEGFAVSNLYGVPLGEPPPPPPRVCFGREGLIDEIVQLAETFEPIALVGAGGIGKTSIALTVLHHDRIVEQFKDNRRFIRCDQFPPSRLHFLSRLSKAIGAGVENPEDLAPLQPLLSSQKMLIVLDNAESILDPQVTNAQEIYAIVDQLYQFKTVCLCITSRIATVPRHCKRPEIPALSMEAACNIFYGIYGNRGRSRSTVVNDLLQRLDFHALSITLLATAASHNTWDCDRLAKEWDLRRAQVLRTDYKESLAATIELSLTSPSFYKLGPDGRNLLGVVAFFPQGIDEQNLDWFFPAIPDRKEIFDKFCVLSLTYRNNGFITMLAPIRDYLCPPDPKSSPLLLATKDRYFSRLSVDIHPNLPEFGQARWIISEDVNVEHLIDVFTSIDESSNDAWTTCRGFMEHLYWHKPRQTVLQSKIEGLPDEHPLKPSCLSGLSRLFQRVGNHEERKRLLITTLKLGKERKDDFLVAESLRFISDANRRLGFYGEGIQQAKEASELFERLSNMQGQANSLLDLARLLVNDNQLEAAEDVTSRLIALVEGKGQESLICQSYHVLGNIYRSKGKKEEAIGHFKTSLAIASPFNWHQRLYATNLELAFVFLEEGKFDDATTHIKQAKSHVVNDTYSTGEAMEAQAEIWYREHRFKDAKSEALGALELFEQLRASRDARRCKDLLRKIEEAKK